MDKKKNEKKATTARGNRGKATSVSEGAPAELETSQVKIDSMLPQISKEEHEEHSIDDLLKLFDDMDKKICKLASKDFIEKNMKKLAKEDFVNEKLSLLRNELSSEIKVELDKVRDQVQKVKEKLVDSIHEVEDLRNAQGAVQVKLEEIAEENIKISKQNEELRENVKERDFRLKMHDKYINDLEQYTRKNSIRIYGLDDKFRNESVETTIKMAIKTLNSKLDAKLLPSDIDIAHRLGKFDVNANRPVICKFVSRVTKIRIIMARRQLKGTQIVIREDLTTKNAKLLETLSTREEISNVWSDDGKIIGLLLNGTKMRFDITTDISQSLIPKDELTKLLAAKKTST